MRAIDRLKRDHELLRAKLGMIESALRMGPPAWFVLREVCFTLAQQLDNHIRREELLIARSRGDLSDEVVRMIAASHQSEPEHLAAIQRFFVAEGPPRFELLRAALTDAVGGLRVHMDWEDARLFPLLERCAGAEDFPADLVALPVHPTMTVNRVLREYPSTRSVFARLFVNLAFEGNSCLDEVAWRHGMEAEDLLVELAPSIAVDEAARQVRGDRPAGNHATASSDA